MIYVFDLTNKKVRKYGFKPFHKRKRFRDPKIFYFSTHFFLLLTHDLTVRSPEEYFELVDRTKMIWKEFKVGDYI